MSPERPLRASPVLAQFLPPFRTIAPTFQPGPDARAPACLLELSLTLEAACASLVILLNTQRPSGDHFISFQRFADGEQGALLSYVGVGR